jgi:hypothetical protein
MGKKTRGEYIRPDFIFSYWILVWFILYFLQIVTISPKLWMIFGLLHNVALVFLMAYHRVKFMYFVYFSIVLLLTKILPLIYLRNVKIQQEDIWVSILVFIVYLGWLAWNNKSILQILREISQSIIHGENRTPLMGFIIRTFS